LINGVHYIHLPYQERLEMLNDLLPESVSPLVHVVPPLAMSFEEAKMQVGLQKWEGLVLSSKDAGSEFHIYGPKKAPPRPDGCWKWKPYVESDFVATGWVPSDSKTYFGQVRDLLISQYDPRTKKLVAWGRVGKGLNAEQKKRLADDSLYPFAVEVKFDARTENSRLVGATILRERFDKRPEECFTPMHELLG
jgi:ATP-dependent DNA ligase